MHNDSDEDADSREPKPDNRIVVQYRPIRTSWSQLSVVRHRSYILHLTLSTYCIHSVLCLCSLGMRVLRRMPSYPVWPGPYPSSHCFYPSLCLSGSTGAFLLRTRVGREADSQPDPQEVLKALLGRGPARWQTPRTRQTANMLKMLPQRRSAVAVHYII